MHSEIHKLFLFQTITKSNVCPENAVPGAKWGAIKSTPASLSRSIFSYIRTLKMHIISSHLVCYTTYMCSVATCTVTVDNEMELFCSWLATLYVVMYITWKSYWRSVVLQICWDILLSLVDKIKFCTAQKIICFFKK